MEIIEKFIEAINRLAEALESLTLMQKPQCDCHADPAELVPVQGPCDPGFYEDIEHGPLKKLAESRGLTVPPRTKATTLRKMLLEDDLVKSNGGKPEPVGDGVTDDTGAIQGKIEEDPFAGSNEVEVTRDMVTAELRRILPAAKKAGIEKILQDEAGVLMVKDIPENKLAAVYKAAQGIQ